MIVKYRYTMCGGYRGGRGRCSGNYSRGQNNGRGGRGTAGVRSNLRLNRSENTPTREYKFVTHGVGKQGQTMTFNTVKDHIVYAVQKTYSFGQDIATSLRDEVKFDVNTVIPVRPISSETDADAKRFEQDGLDIAYTAEMKHYVEQKQALSDNLIKAYALI